MKCLRTLLAALVGVAGLPAAATVARAQCDIPLIIGGAAGQANVLILIDSSGSMNEPVYHPSYNPATTYGPSGRFNATQYYMVSTTGTYSPRSFNGSWPTTPTATLVKSDQGESGWYTGNYLNWVFFNATAAQRAAIPTYTKIQSAKSVVNNILNTVAGCRFGIEIYDDTNGGNIICPLGTALATMQTAVNGIDAQSYTPLARAATTALNYFSTTGANAPFQAPCQKSFLVIITDGMPTMDSNVPAYLKANDCGNNDPGSCTSLGTGYPDALQCTAYLDNVTCWMYRNDLRADMSDIQNVATFIVGFTVNGPLLQVSATVGGGEYYTTNDQAGLASALDDAFVNITKRMAAGASVAVVSSEDRQSNRLYRAKYETGTWRGFVEAYTLPYLTGTSPIWEAGALLEARSTSSRNIFTTSTGTNVVNFTTTNAATLQSLMLAASTTEASDLITWERGDSVSGYRSHGGWQLGDIIDASPVALGHPTGFSPQPGYAAFRTANASRQEVLYVPANDGMLHALNTTDGSEMWAYIPKTQLPRVRDYADPNYCHQFFLDATPVAYDMPFSGTWKTALFSGEDANHNGMFALDITDPNNASVLWDVDVSALHGSTNTPTIVRDRTANAYRVCMGTGYNAASAQDTMVVLDATNGSVVSRYAMSPAQTNNRTSEAVCIDKDLDGYDDFMYVGDYSGRIWRFDLRTNPWGKTCLFSCGQPISCPPTLTIDQYNHVVVLFGTGRYQLSTDPADTTRKTIYAVVDDGLGNTYTRTDMVNQTTAINPVTSASHGWMIDLQNGPGERVTHAGALINGTLYVATYQPTTNSCNGGGTSYLYLLDYKDGSAPDHANGTPNQTTAGRTQSMGDGMISDPTLDLVNDAILMQSSNAVVLSQSVAGTLKRLTVRGWRQKWN